MQEKRWLHAAGKVSTCLTIDIVKNLPNSKWSSLNFGVVLLLSTTIDGYPGILMISNPLINMLTSLASCLSTPDIRKVSELDGEPDKSTVGGSSDDENEKVIFGWCFLMGEGNMADFFAEQAWIASTVVSISETISALLN